MTLSARLALPVAVLLAGCATHSEVVPSDHVQNTSRWLEDWDRVVLQAAEKKAPQLELHSGRHLRIGMIGLRPGQALPAPTDVAGAVVVVEGQGVAQLGPRAHPLQPGDVLLLPAKSLSELRAQPDLPFLALTVSPTASAGAVPAKAEVLTVDARKLSEGRGKVQRTLLGELPGQLSLYGIAVKAGAVGRHLHRDHDEFVFLLDGRGTLGWGEEGPDQITRDFISAPISSRSMLLVPAGAPHGYVDESGCTVALSFFGPAFSGEDVHPVEDSAKARAGKQVLTKRD